DMPVGLTASDEERLHEKRFDALDPAELVAIQRLMGQLKIATPRRRTRRTEHDRLGERIDLRRTLRTSRRSGGDPLRLARRRRRGMARGAVVVILSDGWERGDPDLVRREMARLDRLAYRIVWVNPRASARGFTPSVGGMAAALPHIDALVSGDTLAALGDVVA